MVLIPINTIAILTVGLISSSIIVFWIKKLLNSRLILIDTHLAFLSKVLKEKERQQQVLYNISTSIFILDNIKKIISSVLSEITVMYQWPNIAYLPQDNLKNGLLSYGQPIKLPSEQIFKMARGGAEVANITLDQSKSQVGIFLVGSKNNPLGVLYATHPQGQFTQDQVLFFKTVAHLLTLAMENNQTLPG